MTNDICHDLRTRLHVIMGHVRLLLEKINRNGQDGERNELEVIYDNSLVLAQCVNDLLKLYEAGRAIGEMEERDRIAREVHDGLAQHLGLLYTRVATLEAAPMVATVRDELDGIRKLAAKAYDEARTAIGRFKSQLPDVCPLVSLVNAHLHEFSEETNIATELKVSDQQSMQLTRQAKIQVIKIIQEALANVRAHANANRVSMTFGIEEDQCTIDIEDDGGGFTVCEAIHLELGGFGLQIMQERAKLVGGTFEVTSQRGKGTKLTVRLPMEPQERNARVG